MSRLAQHRPPLIPIVIGTFRPFPHRRARRLAQGHMDFPWAGLKLDHFWRAKLRFPATGASVACSTRVYSSATQPLPYYTTSPYRHPFKVEVTRSNRVRGTILTGGVPL